MLCMTALYDQYESLLLPCYSHSLCPNWISQLLQVMSLNLCHRVALILVAINVCGIGCNNVFPQS